MILKFEVLQRVLGLHNRFCYKRGCKPSDRLYDNQTVWNINLRFSWLKNSIFFFNEMRPSRKKIAGIVVNNAVGKDIPFYQVNERKIIIFGLVSEVPSAFLWAVELKSSDCRRTPSVTERMLG